MTLDAIAVPPAPDEAEFSVFGPGVGECIVVHLGKGRWMVVDSCLEAKQPVALKYLERIGVSPDAVSDLVVTHWHDDHIRGASAILDAAPKARIICSAALNCDEFRRLLKACSLQFGGDCTATEMHALATACAERQRLPSGPRSWIWGIEGQQLIHSPDANVHILSPSSATVTLAFQELGKLVPQIGPKLRPVAQKPNKLAVVLWVEVGGTTALLGSDLENTGNPGTGWGAVVGSTLRPQGQASVFKTAHHGSAGADAPEVWATMLSPGCIAVTTPYNALREAIPTASDQQRIRSHAARHYLTSQPGGKRSRRSADVAKKIRQMTRDLREVSRAMGHVRIRAKRGGSPRVELFGSATKA